MVVLLSTRMEWDAFERVEGHYSVIPWVSKWSPFVRKNRDKSRDIDRCRRVDMSDISGDVGTQTISMTDDLRLIFY